MKDFDFKPVSVTVGDATVEFLWLEEGRDGDYDPTDPADYPHLRMDAKVGDEDRDSQSYCTAINGQKVDREKLERFAEAVAAEFNEHGMSKRRMQQLSWINEGVVNGY